MSRWIRQHLSEWMIKCSATCTDSFILKWVTVMQWFFSQVRPAALAPLCDQSYRLSGELTISHSSSSGCGLKRSLAACSSSSTSTWSPGCSSYTHSTANRDNNPPSVPTVVATLARLWTTAAAVSNNIVVTVCSSRLCGEESTLREWNSSIGRLAARSLGVEFKSIAALFKWKLISLSK